MPYQLPSRLQLVAHRGNSGIAPENARLALEQAIGLGVNVVEVDVRVGAAPLSRDGVPALIHNPALEQTTDGSGRVARHALAKLKQLDAGRWKGPQFVGEPHQTLSEALELARQGVALNLDWAEDR